MDLPKDLLAPIFEHTDLWPPIRVALAIFGSFVVLLRCLTKKGYPSYIKLASVVVGLGLVVLNFNLFLHNSRVLYVVSGLSLVVPLAVFLWKYCSLNRKLQRVKSSAEPQAIDFNRVAAWELLQSLSPKRMVPRQRERYKLYRVHLLLQLGNISAVDAIIDEFKADKAFYHLIQHMKYRSMGRIKDASQAMKLAEEFCTTDTDPHVYVQILSNRGCSHISEKNYQLADDYFHKAIELYKKHKMRDKELLGILYYNYAFNKTRLGDDAWEDVLEEYKSYLNMKQANDAITYFNIHIELLRQTDADRIVIEKAVRKSFDRIMACEFPEENKYFFVSSVARIVWSARVNPEPCLQALTDNLETLFVLPMPARYNAFKNIDLLFMDLHGPIVELYKKLKETAHNYMQGEAEKDLESYRKSLPAEAVEDTCFCYKELAGLQKRRLKDYDFGKVSSYLLNAINLYHENASFHEEYLCRMAIMDELCFAKNLDADYKLSRPEEMRQQLAKIEAFLPSLREHPALAEFCLRLSFYCLYLDDYAKCVMYYTRFTQARLSLEHFAPWLHQYYMLTSFAVRVIYFRQAIEAIKESKELGTFRPDIQAWFRTFPNHSGMLDSMLLGKFLGYTDGIPLKLKIWLDPDHNDGKSPRGHMWLWLGLLALNIDLTYAQFADDKHANSIFFHEDRHPFETSESYKIRADGMTTAVRFEGVVVKLLSENSLSPDQKGLLDSLYTILNSHVSPECPSLDTLRELYADTMLPVMA